MKPQWFWGRWFDRRVAVQPARSRGWKAGQIIMIMMMMMMMVLIVIVVFVMLDKINMMMTFQPVVGCCQSTSVWPDTLSSCEIAIIWNCYHMKLLSYEIVILWKGYLMERPSYEIVITLHTTRHLTNSYNQIWNNNKNLWNLEQTGTGHYGHWGWKLHSGEEKNI